MKKLLSIACLFAVTSCSYPIMNKNPEGSKHAKSCAYAPLWLAPIGSDYANAETIAKENGINKIHTVEQKVYPFVLFTKSCVKVTGN